MIKTVSILNFKCYENKKSINLAPITILYGQNGRGKSSLSQVLLLIGQSMMERNDIDILSIVGDQIQLDSFNDIKTKDGQGDEIKFWIDTEDEHIELGFTAYEGKPQLGKLSTLIFNGENRFDVQSTQVADNNDSLPKVAFSTSDITFLQQLKDLIYISAGRLGPVNDVLRNDSLPQNRIGTKGESLLNAMAHQSKDFINYVGKCLSEILGGGRIDIPDKEASRLELMINSRDDSGLFRPINVGFGYSYVLPVIVGVLLAEKGSVIIIENPEAHLHPGAQSRIMKFLIKQALEKDLQIIVETHSDHVVNGLRISMKNKDLKKTDGIIQHFAYTADGKLDITPIYCDPEGNLSKYPEDFMDEWTAQMMQLL